MKKCLLLLIFFLINTLFVTAEDNLYNTVSDGEKVYYSLASSSWSKQNLNVSDIILVKYLVDGTGSASVYNYEDGQFAFALATDCELISNGLFVVIDNNLLKYYKIIYNKGSYEQILLSDEELKILFPNADIFKMSWLDSDNKVWINKPFAQKRSLLLVNDTDECFHRLETRSKLVQDKEIKGLITIKRYGIYRFKHFGKRDGKIIFYVR